MAHGITSTDTMFSVRETPWHRLGVVLPQYPGSMDEALVQSGLKWPVEQHDVFIASRNPEDHAVEAERGTYLGAFQKMEGHKANIRGDTGDLLGVVSDDYVPVQNTDAFAFLDDLIGSELHFETAGSIHGGKRVWVLARLPEFVEVGGDQVGQYIYVANSHDGSLALTAAVSPIRIVCNNTLSWALKRSDGSQRTYKFRHTGSVRERMYAAREVMEITVNYAERFKALGDELARASVTPTQVERVLVDLFPIEEDDGDRARNNRRNSREKVRSIFRGDNGTEGNAPGTAWTLANAIGEYADWERRTTSKTNQMVRSFEDSDLKQKGLELVLAHTGTEAAVAA